MAMADFTKNEAKDKNCQFVASNVSNVESQVVAGLLWRFTADVGGNGNCGSGNNSQVGDNELLYLEIFGKIKKKIGPLNFEKTRNFEKIGKCEFSEHIKNFVIFKRRPKNSTFQRNLSGLN